MYCWNCGSELDDKAEICLKCGVKANANKNDSPPAESDGSCVGYGVLSFFFPIVGLILWLIWREQFPKKAKSAGLGALISVALDVFATIVIFAIFLPLMITGIILL